jgi:hypothetical protein
MKTKLLVGLAVLGISASVNADERSMEHRGDVDLKEYQSPYSGIFLEGDYTITQREFALKVCLNINYERLGVYKTKSLKDYTRVERTLDPQKSIELIEFIEERAGRFYAESLPIESEIDPPPYNAIFGRCINFSKSSDLKAFLLKLHQDK